MALGSRGAFALVLLVGIAGTGIAVWLFNAAGLGTLGSFVWVLGYGSTVLVLWYVWIRPMELTGPTGTGPEPADSEETE